LLGHVVQNRGGGVSLSIPPIQVKIRRQGSIIKTNAGSTVNAQSIKQIYKIWSEPEKLINLLLVAMRYRIEGFRLIDTKYACRDIMSFAMGNTFNNID
jgi:hypothetical protein